jgi:hypothetical protein
MASLTDCNDVSVCTSVRAGLDFIWEVYLRNPDARIAGIMRNQLLWLYHCSSLQCKSAIYKRALIQ